MRIALAQINPTLGQFVANRLKILEYIQRAQSKHCQLVVFPEAAVFGYHPFDLFERQTIVEEQLKSIKWLESKIPAGLSVIVGCFTENKSKKGRPYFNSAALLEKGKKTKFFHKQLLPTGDVFDESRFLESGKMSDNVVKIHGHRTLITICEDIWAWPDEKGHSVYKENPIKSVKGPIDLVINLSASPFYPGKIKTRQRLVSLTAKHFKAPMAYVNLVGGQDELIFDGASFAMDAKGKLLAQNLDFSEDLNVMDLQKKEGGIRPLSAKADESRRKALILGLQDFVRKSGFKKVVLGLSGGIDSAVVAALAVDALGAGAVSGVALPGPYSSPESLALAKKLAKNLNIEFKEINFNEIYEQTKSAVDQALNLNEFGLIHENIQARLRGVLLMAASNASGAMLLTTGNKSEYATGYCTMYGDMCGGVAPIADLTKQEVYGLAAIYNKEYELIPQGIIDRPPTAELRPNQKDQDSLPEYKILDQSVDRLITQQSMMKTTTDRWLSDLLFKTEYKRWQAPPVLKVSKHSFGRGRRWPICYQAESNKIAKKSVK